MGSVPPKLFRCESLLRKMLGLVDGKDRTQPGCPARQISPALVEEILWANSQCIHPKIPMLLFSNQIDEINEFFPKEQSCLQD
jgi:hypothetical protein